MVENNYYIYMYIIFIITSMEKSMLQSNSGSLDNRKGNTDTKEHLSLSD